MLVNFTCWGCWDGCNFGKDWVLSTGAVLFCQNQESCILETERYPENLQIGELGFEGNQARGL